ncbi:MAG TPA: hypothetical protein VFO42_05685 [Sphingomicrobium sp.]|nr:hypothetical protein [Sphingomicrobium sp.]
MIFRRTVANLRAQNWTAVVIEIAIVIIGVFIGVQAANWNQQRLEKARAERLLGELKPSLASFIDFFETADTYYATTRRYADTAFAGWRGDPSVTDEQFVIAAYQASQVYFLGVNSNSWTTLFGRDQLDNIDDPAIRRGLAALMTQDFALIEGGLLTEYRGQVRQVIPEDIQDSIRAKCGDRPVEGRPLTVTLSATCDLDYPAPRFAEAAAELRRQPLLVGLLRRHLSEVASYKDNLAMIGGMTRDIHSRIGSR